MTDETTTHRNPRPMMRGRLPGTLPGKGYERPDPPARFPKYPVRGKLSPIQADVFNLIALEPRTVTACSLALNIESPTAAWAIATLERRGLVEKVADYPSHYGAIS